MLPVTQRISASNGVSTFPTTSIVFGLLQRSSVILSVTSHTGPTHVERFVSLISVSFSQLPEYQVDRTSPECLGWTLFISSSIWIRYWINDSNEKGIFGR